MSTPKALSHTQKGRKLIRTEMKKLQTPTERKRGEDGRFLPLLSYPEHFPDVKKCREVWAKENRTIAKGLWSERNGDLINFRQNEKNRAIAYEKRLSEFRELARGDEDLMEGRELEKFFEAKRIHASP